MPAPEQGGGKGPDRPRGRAVPPQPSKDEPASWYRAARYDAEPLSARAYFRAEETIFNQESDVSAYRMMLEQIYHVAVLGGPRVEAALQEQIENILYAEGTPTQLPDEILVYLAERRQQAQQVGPWVEGVRRVGRAMFTRQQLDQLGVGATLEVVAYEGRTIRLPPSGQAQPA